MKFPCSGCGECCRHVQPYPHMDRGDGTCRHFDEPTRSCSVYESRPFICRIDKAFESRFHEITTAKVYYMAQARVCAALHPDNADIPARTEAALRETGLHDGPEDDDVAGTAKRIRDAIVEADLKFPFEG